MRLSSHFQELRDRGYYLLLSSFLLFCLAFFYSEQLIFFIIKPLISLPQMDGRHMIFTEMSEALETYIYICFGFTFLFMIPFCIYQLWSFWIPSTYVYERRRFTWTISLCLGVFFFACCLIYSKLLPEIWSFFLQFEKTSACLNIELEARIYSYVILTSKLMGALVVLFQCPLYTHFGLELGLLTHNTLQASRKYALLISLLIAAFMSPPDVSSQLTITVIMFSMYELCTFYALYHFCSWKREGN